MQVRNVGGGCCLIIYIWYEYYFWCEFWYEFDGKNNDFDRVVLFMNLVWLKSIDFTSVLNDFWFVNKLVLMCYFFRKFLDFIVSSIEALFYKGWEAFWRYFWWFFTMLKWQKNIDFSRFCRSGYRTQNGGRGMRTSDMPFPAIEHLF